MGATVFVKTSSIFPRRLVVGGADNLISDSTFHNLMRKWVYPWQAGSSFLFSESEDGHVHNACEQASVGAESDYEDLSGFTITEMQRDVVGGKHIMLTVERIDGLDQITAYFLDPVIETQNIDLEDRIVHQDVVNDGNNRIKKLVGGDIGLAASGLSWPVKVTDGTTTLKIGEVLPSPLEEQDFSPFVLFRRNDMA